MSDSNQPHSAPFLADYRDFWWNPDFLELMAQRLKLDRVRTVLDVGCGKGHWGQMLLRFLSKEATLVGVDREEKWVDEARVRAEKLQLGARFTSVRGDANALPFGESSFDLVTCQTLLMHVPDPESTLREMSRVLKPGGLLLVVEPSNLANAGVSSSFSINEPIADVVDRFRFNLTCHRGKMALGLGYSSIGDLLPGIFAKVGVKDIQVYLSDKASALFPPYEGTEQQTLIHQIKEWSDKDLFVGTKTETQRLFLAGGGAESEFERLWDIGLKENRALNSQVAKGAYYCGGAGIHYVVSARR